MINSLIQKIDMELPSNIEFYTFNDEAWIHHTDGTAEKLTEDKSDLICAICNMIEVFYPGAAAALGKEYERCIPNLSYYRFRIVQRFIKCNFGNIDKTADIDAFGRIHLECVPCPLRGECKLENVVCRPVFAHQLSDAEMRVLRLWHQGLNKDEIAEELYLSAHTVNNHIRNAYIRLGIHSKAEFVKYAENNHLFQ